MIYDDMKLGEKDEDSESNNNIINYGHTENEWGKSITNNKKETNTIFTYKIKWESTI